jgi:hypothetical protein
MKSILLLGFCFLTVVFGDVIVAGRLDSYDDIGYLTPKNVFQISQNVYLKTYFDIENDTIDNMFPISFAAELWNGTWENFYENKAYTPAASAISLLIGGQSADGQIDLVLNLNPTVFPVVYGAEEALDFELILTIDYDFNKTETYAVNAQIFVQNNYNSTTDPKSVTTGQTVTTSGQTATTSGTTNSGTTNSGTTNSGTTDSDPQTSTTSDSSILKVSMFVFIMILFFI